MQWPVTGLNQRQILLSPHYRYDFSHTTDLRITEPGFQQAKLIEEGVLKVLNQFDFLLVSFQFKFAKSQTYLVSTTTS